jgi:NNP family nitrate/nitrite transporter-like MFS transporter
VAGIVGAGGNAGAVLAGYLFKTPRLTYPQAFLVLGFFIAAFSLLAFAVRFSEQDERSALQEIEARRAARLAAAAATGA